MDRTEDIKRRLARFEQEHDGAYAEMTYANWSEDVEHLLKVIADLQAAAQPSPELARKTPLTAADLDALEAPVKKWVDEQPESTFMAAYALGRLRHSDVLLDLISMARDSLNLVDADEYLKPVYEERDGAWSAADQIRFHILWFANPDNYRSHDGSQPKVLRDGLMRARRAKEGSLPGARYHLPAAALDEIGLLREALDRIALMPLNGSKLTPSKMQRIALEALRYTGWLQASRNVDARRRQYRRLKAFVQGLAKMEYQGPHQMLADVIVRRAKAALEGNKREEVSDPAIKLLEAEDAKGRMWYAKYYLAVSTEKTAPAARKALEEAKARLEELGINLEAFVV